jgi:hypothetical protein
MRGYTSTMHKLRNFIIFRFKIKYLGVLTIVGEPAIDSRGHQGGGVVESTCFELKTLMEYYTSSADQETYARLKTARLVCSMAVVQCGFFEPTFLGWARKLKGQYTHPFIIGMNLLYFADVINNFIFYFF